MNKGFTSILFLVAIVTLVGVAGYYFVTTEEVSAPTLIEQEPSLQASSTPIAVPISSSPVVVPTPAVPSVSNSALLRDCPQTWYDNRMPMVIEPGQPRPVTQYFIYKGERRELAEFDMAWVSANCQIAPSVVY